MESTTDEHGYLRLTASDESWKEKALRYEDFLRKAGICLICGSRMRRTPVGPVCSEGHTQPPPKIDYDALMEVFEAAVPDDVTK